MAMVVGVAGGMAGCEIDSYLDPSVYGRWEHTPTIVPILDRIASVEEKEGQFVETSTVQADDLKPEASEYRLGPGDSLQVRVRDLYLIGQDAIFEPRVNQRGFIVIPGYEPIRAYGLTDLELRAAISERIAEAGIITNPTVAVEVQDQRQLTFNVLGDVRNPGTFFIPEADYRVLDAITAAGGLNNEQSEEVLVVRQVPLSDAAVGLSPNAETTGSPAKSGGSEAAPDVIDLIDSIGTPEKQGERPSPAMRTPEPDPPIDLIEPSSAAPAAGPASQGPGWTYINGEWARVSMDGSGGAGTLVTQRVISIPVDALLSGAAEYNIVVRPGDLIRVPTTPRGFVYLGGEVSRPGVFSLPSSGRLTLLRAFTSAGGLAETAIPERVDLYRMVGPDRQAIVRLNGKAIGAGTQPDIFLKPDDHIIVGTNFWAFPLAVIRNGFRATYGFGFLLDRNFGNDVFGPPPTNVGRSD